MTDQQAQAQAQAQADEDLQTSFFVRRGYPITHQYQVFVSVNWYVSIFIDCRKEGFTVKHSLPLSGAFQMSGGVSTRFLVPPPSSPKYLGGSRFEAMPSPGAGGDRWRKLLLRVSKARCESRGRTRGSPCIAYRNFNAIKAPARFMAFAQPP